MARPPRRPSATAVGPVALTDAGMQCCGTIVDHSMRSHRAPQASASCRWYRLAGAALVSRTARVACWHWHRTRRTRVRAVSAIISVIRRRSPTRAHYRHANLLQYCGFDHHPFRRCPRDWIALPAPCDVPPCRWRAPPQRPMAAAAAKSASLPPARSQSRRTAFYAWVGHTRSGAGGSQS